MSGERVLGLLICTWIVFFVVGMLKGTWVDQQKWRSLQPKGFMTDEHSLGLLIIVVAVGIVGGFVGAFLTSEGPRRKGR